MKLVVVESPAKAKTINKYLGKDYIVLASYGHVRDLPSKDGSVDPEDHFKMKWAMDVRSKKQVADLVAAAKKSDEILLATDPDREGEAISWHVKKVLQEQKTIKDKPFSRVVFHEITKTAILKAIDNPRPLDEALIQAYLARRALDYLVGFNLSPILWRKLPGSRSAGRVQSVALRIITDREAEIEKFIAQEYWSVLGLFGTAAGKDFETRLTHLSGKKLEKITLGSEEDAKTALAAIQAQTYDISKVERKQTKRNPTAPFTTSTLQQEASRKLRFGSKRTMQLAQRLYEGISLDGETVGLITYMRTDSVTVAQEALDTTRVHIEKAYGKDYLPAAQRTYKSKAKNAQEAHEAVRPTDIFRTPDSVKAALDEDQFKLYELIWKRMVSSQMESAKFNQLTIDISSKDKNITFRATGSTLLFDGFLKLYEEGKDTDDDENNQRLPDVKEGEKADLKKVTPNQHFTQPPPRFTEASLVKRLEELGIGRPSTYASIMSTLLDRSYVRLEKRQLIPEGLGRVVTTFLVQYFQKYLEYDFTADLEEQLDGIAEGDEKWEKALQDFWIPFKKAVDETAPLRITEVIDFLNEQLGTFLFPVIEEGKDPRKCSSCDEGQLSLKLGRYGAFVGCSNYPECNNTRQLGKVKADEEAIEGVDMAAKFEPKTLGQDPERGLDVTVRKGPYGFYFQWGEAKPKEKPKRVALPKCKNPDEATLEEALTLGALPKTLGNHPESGEEIILGLGRFGPYVKYQGKFTSIPKGTDHLKVTLDDAVDIIANAPVKKAKAPATKKVEPKKTATKKAAPKKTSAKKEPAKKTAAKKAAPKKAKA